MRKLLQSTARRTAHRNGYLLAVAAVLAFGALISGALPAAAEVIRLDLANGEHFDTLYRPQEASWDSDLLLFLTDTGSWVAVPKADVVEITSETESRGYGRVVDTSTIVLGYAANDAPLPEDPSQFSTIDALQQLFQQQSQGQDYTVQQFVEPGQAGGSTGGLPAYGATAPDGFNYISGNLGLVPGGAAPAAPLAAAPGSAVAAPSPAASDPVDQ